MKEKLRELVETYKSKEKKKNIGQLTTHSHPYMHVLTFLVDYMTLFVC